MKENKANFFDKLQETGNQEIQRLVHDLQIYHIELEMQNQELRRAQLNLEASHNKYFDLFELAPIGYFTIDKSGIILDANLTGANQLGVEKIHLIKTEFAHYIASDYQDVFYFHRKQLFETEKVQTCELKMVKTDGSQFYVQLESIVVPDDSGAFSQFRTAIIDLNERKQAEEALQTSHHFLEIANRHTEMNSLLKDFLGELKHFTSCAAIGIRILDQEGNIPYQVYDGFSQEFYESESPLSIKSDQCMCVNVIKGETNSKVPFYTESGSFYTNGATPLLTTVSEGDKGKTRNVCNQFGYESVALVPIRFGGRTLGLIHVADPRENMIPVATVKVIEYLVMQLGPAIQRVRMEEAVREERDRAKKYLDIAGVIFAVIDADGKITLINKKGSEILGYREEEIIGKNWVDNFIPERIKDEVKAVFVRLMAGEIEPYEYFENTVLTKSGEERIIAWHNTILKDESGNIIGTLSSGEDITERNLAEAELNQYREHLEKIVAARTEELINTNEQLQLEIEERNLAEGKVRTYQERLRSLASELSLTEERERRRIATELHDYIGQTLAISKIKLGELRSLAASNDIAEKINAVRELIEQAIQHTRSLTFALSPPILYTLSFGAAVEWLIERFQEQHGIGFNFEEDKYPKPMDDEIRIILFKAVRELLLNIVKHARANKGTITIRRDCDSILINIEDDGIGFDTSKIDLNLGENIGFGLFNIYEQLNRLSGHLEIESEPGRGTRVTLMAPLASKVMGEQS
jgi:PAS domain S-box-containing protein